MNSLSQILSTVSIMALPLLLAVVLHEYAHGWVANFFGDSTAKDLGRLTLNPIPHIDRLGTIIVPILCLLLPGSFLVGWAKPVPVHSARLFNPRRDMALVAAAGPAMNFLLVLASAVLLSVLLSLDSSILSSDRHADDGASSLAQAVTLPLAAMAQFSIVINTILMVINLVPIPPLDGGRIMASLLPRRQALLLSRLEPYGMFLFIGLLMTDSYTHVLRTILMGVFSLLTTLILPNELIAA